MKSVRIQIQMHDCRVARGPRYEKVVRMHQNDVVMDIGYRSKSSGFQVYLSVKVDETQGRINGETLFD